MTERCHRVQHIISDMVMIFRNFTAGLEILSIHPFSNTLHLHPWNWTTTADSVSDYSINVLWPVFTTAVAFCVCY